MWRARAAANIPFNYVVNQVSCPAHTDSPCAASLAFAGVLGFLNPATQFLL